MYCKCGSRVVPRAECGYVALNATDGSDSAQGWEGGKGMEKEEKKGAERGAGGYDSEPFSFSSSGFSLQLGEGRVAASLAGRGRE